ncbi:MAG TPA: ABC transporter ATP-binding protein, partial [Blastocatellia bacterium]|nr:ABC transporter ATP-binding protein [Blastocatellia bacterium]
RGKNVLLAVEGISKRFGRTRALEGVSFTARPGEVLGLIGPNGAGKTTLFECVAGLLSATGGSVRFRDERLPVARRKEALFYMPDGIIPWAGQKVKWVIGFFEKLYAVSEVKADSLVEPLKLERLRNARVGSLSKGERKRVMLALALLTPQPLLMLDEPFDGLDLRQTRDVMSLLKSHAARGRTLMLSIHQLTDAARVCDRLVLLSAGRVVGEGSIAELRVQANLPEAGLEEIFLALT